MHATKVIDNVYQLSVNVEDILFEGIWDIPNGVSINSFIVKGEKTAIIDGVGDWDGVPEKLFTMLEELEIDPKSIEYAVINHMEPDHSGWINDLKKINPELKIVCGERSAALLDAFYGQRENIKIVGDGDSLDLGDGHILDFVEIPNVHWPDTIATFHRPTGTLFPCDAFGSFGKFEGSNYDDELSEEELAHYEEEAVRYYANIVASFSGAVEKAIEKAGNLPIKIIAPGHGIVWRKDPTRIINDYVRYASYQKGPAKEEITVLWSSMYGMTEKAVKHAIEVLEKEDIKVNVHQLPETPWGTILASAWTSTGVILAMPTYEYKMFPPMASVLKEMGNKKFQNRKAFRIGSYGWSGGAQRELDSIMEEGRMNWDFLEPVEFKGSVSDEELDLIEERVKELVKEVKKAVKEK